MKTLHWRAFTKYYLADSLRLFVEAYIMVASENLRILNRLAHSVA